MTCIPSLQSWCIMPSKKDVYKFTKAHQYLQRNPAAAKRVIDHDRVFYRHLSFYRIRISSYKNDLPNSLNVDVLSNNSDTENNLITAYDIINIIQQWKLVDVLDIKEEETNSGFNSFIVIFKTAISAHIMTKLKNFTDLIQKNITINIEAIDPIPENARVPLVYIQGIGPDVSDDAIRHFFRDMSFILKIERYQRGNIFFHIIKLPTVKNAISLAKQINEGKFNRSNFTSFNSNSNSNSNSSQSFIVASHQYKSTITQCFFITSDETTTLKPDDVRSEVSKFGEIELLFTRNNNNISEFYIKMSSLADAKFACGIMNNRTFDNVTLKAIFISPEYFNDLYSEFSQESQINTNTEIMQSSFDQMQPLNQDQFQFQLSRNENQETQSQSFQQNPLLQPIQQNFENPQKEENFQTHEIHPNAEYLQNGDVLQNVENPQNQEKQPNQKYHQIVDVLQNEENT